MDLGRVYIADFVDGHLRVYGKNALAAFIEQDLVDETTLMLDSTTIKVHQHASGVKKGAITKKQGEAEAD